MELKPCPFCGGKAKIRSTTTGTYPNHGKHYCYCEKCLASGQSFSDFEDDGSSIFKAVEAWNRIADTTADVTPVRHGRWTDKRTWEHDGEWYCSACNKEITIYMGPDRKDRYAYCPNCGAKMDG